VTTEQLLAIVERRGLKIILVQGRPVLTRPHGNKGVTDNLPRVLKRHRERIIEKLSSKPTNLFPQGGNYV
jgi:hypothetical protein